MWYVYIYIYLHFTNPSESIRTFWGSISGVIWGMICNFGSGNFPYKTPKPISKLNIWNCEKNHWTTILETLKSASLLGCYTWFSIPHPLVILFFFNLPIVHIYIYIYIWYIYICMHMYIWFRYHCIIEVPPVIIHFRGIFPGIFHPARKGFPIHLRCQRRSKDLAGTCRRLRRSRYVVGVAFPRKMVSKWSWNQKTWWIVVDLS